MRVILDTGVFFHPEALGMMEYFLADIVVPAIVFTERARQIARDGGDVARFERLLADIGATIEPFSHNEGKQHATSISNEHWARLARDAMIAGHVRAGDCLFTTNPRDFLDLGVPQEQIIEIPIWRTKERVRKSATS